MTNPFEHPCHRKTMNPGVLTSFISCLDPHRLQVGYLVISCVTKPPPVFAGAKLDSSPAPGEAGTGVWRLSPALPLSLSALSHGQPSLASTGLTDTGSDRPPETPGADAWPVSLMFCVASVNIVLSHNTPSRRVSCVTCHDRGPGVGHRGQWR